MHPGSNTAGVPHDSYDLQGLKAIAWCSLLVAGWLLMRLSCYLGLPNDCIVPQSELEILTDFVVLVAFALVQAWVCEVVEARRFRKLRTSWSFYSIYVSSLFIVSGLQSAEAIPKPTITTEDFSIGQWIVSIILGIAVIIFLLWHFSIAWQTLPGVRMVSGGVDIHDSSGEDNPLSTYFYSRAAIVAYCLVYCAFAFVEGHGWGYHYALLAWMLSLVAQFSHPVSKAFLALTTGVFVQGIGAYGLRFLCLAGGNLSSE